MDSKPIPPSSSININSSASGVPVSPIPPRSDIPPPPPATTSVAPPPPQTTVSHPPPPQASMSSAPTPSKGSGKRLLLIVVVLLLLTAVGFFVYKFVSKSRQSQQITLTYWGLWESADTIRPLLTDFESSHPNIKVEYTSQSPTEYRERLQSALSQNKGPDVFRIHNTWLPMFRNNLSPMPVTVYSTTDYQSIFYPAAYNDLRLGNSIYAIPLEIDGLAMYVNDDLLTQAGQSVPQTWDDLRNVAVAASKCDTVDKVCRPGAKVQVSGVAMGTTENVDHWQDIIGILMLQNNVDLGNVSKNAAAASDVVNYYKSFTETYNVWDPALPTSTSQFIDGKLAIYFGPSWRVFDIKSANPNLKFSVYPLPQVPTASDRQEQPVTWASYWAEGVNKKSPNQDAAWELLKFLSSSDSLKKLYAQEMSSPRQFGEPYPRTDLADEVKNEPYIGPYISQAVLAKSWYLTSFTHDGPTGINTRISNLFSQVLSRTLDASTLSSEINKVLSDYAVSVPNPAGN